MTFRSIDDVALVPPTNGSASDLPPAKKAVPTPSILVLEDLDAPDSPPMLYLRFPEDSVRSLGADSIYKQKAMDFLRQYQSTSLEGILELPLNPEHMERFSIAVAAITSGVLLFLEIMALKIMVNYICLHPAEGKNWLPLSIRIC